MKTNIKFLIVLLTLFIFSECQIVAQDDLHEEEIEVSENNGIFDALEFSDFEEERLGDKEIITFLENNLPEFSAELKVLKKESHEEYKDALELANIEILIHRRIVNMDRDAGQANIALHRILFQLEAYIEGLFEKYEEDENEPSEAEQNDIQSKIRKMLEEGLPLFIRKSQVELLIMEKDLNKFSSDQDKRKEATDSLVNMIMHQDNENEEEERDVVEEMLPDLDEEEMDIDYFQIFQKLSVSNQQTERLSDKEIKAFIKIHFPDIYTEVSSINRNHADEYREAMDELNELVIIHNRIKPLNEEGALALIEVIKIESELEKILESRDELSEENDEEIIPAEDDEKLVETEIKKLIVKGLDSYILSQKSELTLMKQELKNFESNVEEQKEAIDFLLEIILDKMIDEVEGDEEEGDDNEEENEEDDDE